MEIRKVLKEALEVGKKNPVIFVPIITLSVIMFLLSVLLLGDASFPIDEITSFQEIPHGMQTMVWIITGLGILNLILWLFVHGMTVGMAQQAVEKGGTTLNDGIDVAKDRFLHLLVGAVLMGFIVFSGFMFFILPGAVASFFLMFTLVAIVVEDLKPVEGLKRSFAVVKTHAGEAFLLFSVLVLLGLLFGIASAFFSIIPVIGQALQILLSGGFGGFVSVLMVLVYKNLSKPELVIEE